MHKHAALLLPALLFAPLASIAAQTTGGQSGDRARATTAKISTTNTNSAAALAAAAGRGDLGAVRSLLAANADPNFAQGDGMTALHWAADHGDTVMTSLLLKAGAKVSATTRLGANTPLHVAARNGRAGAVRALLSAGSNANALTSGGASALHLAAEAGNADAVSELIKHGANVNAREGEWGQTPLMFAAAANRPAAIAVLLKNKADPSLLSNTVDLTASAQLDQTAAKKRN